MKTKRDCSFLPFQFAINVDLLYNIMKCNLEEYAMNAVGEIGNFIITYQEPLQVAALVALVALVIVVVICIGKAIASAGRKQRMLEEIRTVQGKKTYKCGIMDFGIKLLIRMPGRCGKLARKVFAGQAYEESMSVALGDYQVVDFPESIRRTEGMRKW